MVRFLLQPDNVLLTCWHERAVHYFMAVWFNCRFINAPLRRLAHLILPHCSNTFTHIRAFLRHAHATLRARRTYRAAFAAATRSTTPTHAALCTRHAPAHRFLRCLYRHRAHARARIRLVGLLRTAFSRYLATHLRSPPRTCRVWFHSAALTRVTPALVRTDAASTSA